MSTQRTVCVDCVANAVHRLPLSAKLLGFATGALGFLSAFLEDRPERCDSCETVRPFCFRYKADDNAPCVHCGARESVHAGRGHDYHAEPSREQGAPPDAAT